MNTVRNQVIASLEHSGTDGSESSGAIPPEDGTSDVSGPQETVETNPVALKVSPGEDIPGSPAEQTDNSAITAATAPQNQTPLIVS